MEFTLRTEEASGAYEYIVDDERLAEITWLLRGDVMHMSHTYVSNVLRGQGIAKKLLDAAADYARQQGYKMNAICSYVVAAFEKTNDYADVKA